MKFRNLRSLALRGYSDEQLIAAFRLSGDSRFTAELFGRHLHVVLGVCTRYSKDPDDLVMTVFEKALKNLERSHIRHFNAWIYKISIHVCISWVRQQRRYMAFQKHLIQVVEDAVHSDERLTYETLSGAQDEMQYNLRRALERLDERQRLCIMLFFFEGKTYKEISQITGMPTAEVKSHLQNGKNRLRRLLKLHKSYF